MILAWGGTVSLAVGVTLVGVFDLPLPWAVVAVMTVLALILFEGAYRTNARLRVELADWEARAVSLPSRLDTLIIEGAALLGELPQAAPVATHENGYSVPLLPDQRHADRVEEFDRRVRDLLMRQRPSLLPVYAEGINAAIRKAGEAREVREKEIAENGDDAARSKDFADRQHRIPAIQLEAFLRGLSDARNLLGH